jgi:predicted MFS family arabinose efflux permease
MLNAVYRGWTAPATLGGLAGAAVLLATFVAQERRSSRPMVRLALFADRRRATGYATMLLLGMATMGSFVLTALLVQDILHYSPLRAGLAYLGFTVGMTPAFGLGPKLIMRYGVRPVLSGGLLLHGVGTALLAGTARTAGYWTWLLPAMIVVGLGLGLIFISIQVAVLDGVREREAGVAAATLNASQQVGAALGVAVVMTVTFGQVRSLLSAGQDPVGALLGGLHRGLILSTVVAGLLAVLVAAFIGRLVPTEMPQEPVELDLSEIDEAPVRAAAS